MKVPIVIAGAGLCGLAAARALAGSSFRIFEAQSTPGGLCRSVHHKGYTFDYTGHLLHLKGESLNDVQHLLGDNLALIERRARIHTHGVRCDYPFQIHLHALPEKAREECVSGFEAVADKEIDTANFAAWCRSVFGNGITEHFMRPYNEKLLRTRLEDLSSDWVNYIPRPLLSDVRAGAAGHKVAGVGYNSEFRYPVKGGIGALPEALAADLHIELNAPLERVSGSGRSAKFGSEWVPYEKMISTIPLPALVNLIEDAPAEIKNAAKNLEAVGVLCLNLGIAGDTGDAHWIYFPEKKYPFFRVGFYHNISPSSAPAGKSALYVETSFRSREDLPEKYLDQAVEGLIDAGILKSAAQVEECVPLWLDAAYAIHTPRRVQALAAIIPYLESIGILPAGRYGRWAYTSMGDALKEGAAVAKRALEPVVIPQAPC